MDPQEGGATWKDTYDVWIEALESNYREVIEGAAGFVPNLISAAILLVVGWLLATGLRFLILRFGTRLDRLFQAARERLGPAQGELRWPLSRILAFVVYWLVIVFFLAVVSETLGLPGLSDAFDEILFHLPILLICAVVLFVVYLLSGVAANAVTTAARSSGVRNSRLLGRAVRVLIMTLAVIVVISQLGIDLTLLVNIVTIIAGMMLGGLAVAFGIGAGGVAGNVIAAHYVRQTYRIGQRVAVDSFEGEILEITRHAVILDTKEGRTQVPARLFNETASVLVDAGGKDDQ